MGWRKGVEEGDGGRGWRNGMEEWDGGRGWRKSGFKNNETGNFTKIMCLKQNYLNHNSLDLEH